MLSIVFGSILAILFYCYVVWSKGYFSRRGIKHVPYTFPIIGNSSNVLTRTEVITKSFDRKYSTFPDQKYVGFMQFTVPFIMIRDVDLLKQVVSKDFDHFANRQMSGAFEPLYGRTLVSLKDDEWKLMRSSMGPAFSSLKMKNMFGSMEKIALQMNEYHLQKIAEQNNKALLEVEMNDIFRRFFCDTIATTTFDIEIDSFSERENKFFEYGIRAGEFSGVQFVKASILGTLPKLCSLLQIKLNHKYVDFFRQTFLINMKKRQENNVVRHDLIQVILDLKKKSLKHHVANDHAEFKNIQAKEFTDEDWTAQAVSFIAAGFESSPTTLSFVAHELALNPHIQKRLQQEIDAVIKEKGQNLNYSDLTGMKYMDMVISETLRKWPIVVISERKCTKQYTLPPPCDSSKSGYTVNFDPFLCYELEINDVIIIPIYSIHHDPKYYPNPDKFDPERFSDENKRNLKPDAYIPFGVGPRSCIGKSHVLMMMKTAIFYLLAKFDIVTTDKTKNPIELRTDAFFLKAKNGFWAGLVPRN